MDPVTVEMIKQWFGEAPTGSSHMIVAVDEFDWSTYPIYVSDGEDVRKRHAEEHRKPLQRVMEVYRLDYSFDKQVVQHRCCVYDLPPDGHDDRVLEVCAALSLESLERARLSALEVARVCRVELARRRAAEARQADRWASDRYEFGKRQKRFDDLTRSSETDGEAPGPSPIDATEGQGEVDLLAEPSAPGASPSNSKGSE